MAEGRIGDALERWGPRLAMVAGVLAWLWPIGLGGRMPIGGDATQFSAGLMVCLRDALRAGRLPLWNDLWGFGFPSLAESQMGVYYPPHWPLYGLLPTEFAGVASLVLHTLWGAIGAYWAARRLGASEVGSALAGFAWSTSGFFLIHQPHHWAATVGSWMPWAWGLAWMVARGEGSRRTPLALAAVLAIQVLPGHFQLAFITEVGALLLALGAGDRSVGRRAAVALAVAGMVPLAALQLWPTYRLDGLSDARRDFEYLSGFAASPIHLVNYIAPGLFHRSPLWRPVAWDPFHTSPEEWLGSVGLVPLFLAALAVARGWRADPATRALAIVAGATVFLSLGPYAPGFGWLIRLPGFSFFRAPARWGLATNLTLSLLAARGFDGLAAWPRTGRSAVRFALAVSAAVLLVVLGFEAALVASKGGARSPLASGFELATKALPWSDRPGSKSFRGVMAEAYRPQSDLRVQAALAKLEGRPTPPPGPTLAGERFAIYRRELGESAAWLAALAAVGLLAGRPRAFAAALAALTLAGGLAEGRHRSFDLGPIRPLVDQSPVLARLSREPRGTRTLDPARNLFQVAGVDPVSAYRTLDLPSPEGLLRLARLPVSAEARSAEARRVAGVEWLILDPLEARGLSPGDRATAETITDPALAGWLLGADLARALGLRDFTLIRTGPRPARAWLAPAKGLESVDGMADPIALLDRARAMRPLATRSEVPERVEVEVNVEAGDPVPAMVVLSATFDPEWESRWDGPGGASRRAEVVRVLGGWQGVAVPEPGRWTLRLEYPGRASRVGLAISAAAWLVWGAGWWRLGVRREVRS